MNVKEILTNWSTKISTTFVDGCRHVWEDHRTALLATVGVLSVAKIAHVVNRRKLRQKWDAAGQDVVVLHGFPRATTCPNLSPFVLKLETYLRMAGFKYEYDAQEPIGPKGKTPWITLNGKDMADSQLIIEYLGKKFNKDFSADLTAEQRAISRALLIMTDEHILWGLAWWRFIQDPDLRLLDMMPLPLWLRLQMKLFGKHVMSERLWTQGMGRHTVDEITEMIRKDIEALSLYLGEKPFLMGKSPSEVDCAVFGMVAQFVWGLPGSPFAAMVQSDYRNLLHYCARMKERFWPDWNKHLFNQ